MSEQDRTVKVPAVAEQLFGLEAMVDFPTIGVSRRDVLTFGKRPVMVGRVLDVKYGGREWLAQVYHSRRRKALRLRAVSAPRDLFDLDEVEVVGVAVGLSMHRSSAAWSAEIAIATRAWRCEYVKFGEGDEEEEGEDQ